MGWPFNVSIGQLQRIKTWMDNTSNRLSSSKERNPEAKQLKTCLHVLDVTKMHQRKLGCKECWLTGISLCGSWRPSIPTNAPPLILSSSSVSPIKEYKLPFMILLEIPNNYIYKIKSANLMQSRKKLWKEYLYHFFIIIYLIFKGFSF